MSKKLRFSSWLLARILIVLLMMLGVTYTKTYAARPVTYTDYTFTVSGPFYNFDMYINWQYAPPSGYIYPAFNFMFQASQIPGNQGAGGYMGIQLVGDPSVDPNAKKAIFSIWDLWDNSLGRWAYAQPDPNSPQCARFGHEGTGTYCLMNYNWVMGREYRLRIWVLNRDAMGEWWGGWIHDTVTQQETQIGAIYLQNSSSYPGFGWLLRSSTFLEYFGGPDSCDPQPYSRVLWRGPFANAYSYSAASAFIPFYNECSNTDVSTRGYPTVIHSAGSGILRITPAGTILWGSPAMVFYGEGSVTTPRYRTWDGMAWSVNESSAQSVGAVSRWAVVKRNPVRNEIVSGVLDSFNDINLQVWDGTNWGNLVEVTANSSTGTTRAFDIAYEQWSSRTLVVYNDGTSIPKYRIWDGVSWLAEGSVPITRTSGAPRWIRLEPHPYSNKILLAYQDNNNDVNALVWDGSNWGNEQLMETTVGSSGRTAQSFDIAFESQSGRGMVIWSQSGTSTLQYRIWDGLNWSAENAFGNPEPMAASGSTNIYFVRLVADPSSNQLAVGTSNAAYDHYVQIWNGSAWGGGTRTAFALTVDLEFTSTERSFDLAWQRGTGTLFAVYDTLAAANSPGKYRMWTQTGNWSTETDLPAGAVDPVWVQLRTDPYTNDIFVGLLDKQYDINMHRWNGTVWDNSIEVETAAAGGVYRYESFMISYLP